MHCGYAGYGYVVSRVDESNNHQQKRMEMGQIPRSIERIF